MNIFKKILQILTNVVLVISFIIILFCISGFIQLKLLGKQYINYFGYTFFSVATGSMEPTLKVNDVIIVKITDDVKVGNIITYREGKDFITHRVISNNQGKFITKGDSNNSDDRPIDASKIVGKMVFRIKSIGIVSDILLTPKVFVSILITLFLFCLCFSYIPKTKKTILKEQAKEDQKKEDIKKEIKYELKEELKKEMDVKQVIKDKDKDPIKEILNSKKEICLSETADLYYTIKALRDEEESLKKVFENKGKRKKDDI